VRITTAGTSHADDIASRQKRYVMSMALRTVCFVGAVLADGWLRWVLVAGAVVLPYVAVVMANAVGSRDDGFELVGGDLGRPELEEPAATASDRRRDAPPPTL
jgi:hypothetical protein